MMKWMIHLKRSHGKISLQANTKIMKNKRFLISLVSILIALTVISPLIGIAATSKKPVSTPKPTATPSPKNTPAVSASVDFETEVNQFRDLNKDFLDESDKEIIEAANVVKAKKSSDKKAAEKRLAAAHSKKEEIRKRVLLKLIDIQSKQLGRTAERILRMPNIDNAKKTELRSEIDSAIQQLAAEKIKVQNAIDEKTIKSLASEVRDMFKTEQDIVQKIVDAIHVSRFNGIISSAEEKVIVVQAKIQDLKNLGQDTTDLDKAMEEAQNSIDQANRKITKQAYKEAVNSLKDVYQKFISITDKVNGGT